MARDLYIYGVSLPISNPSCSAAAESRELTFLPPFPASRTTVRSTASQLAPRTAQSATSSGVLPAAGA